MNRQDELVPTRLHRTVIYECPWVNLYRDKIALANGRVIEEYHYLDFGPGTIAVIVEDEAGQILMERITRYPTETTSWELPAGMIEEGESAVEAARREVWEETGFESYGHQQIYAYHPMNGIANMTVYVIRCRAGERTGQLDENEIHSARWFSPGELIEMIRRQEIPDGYALVGLLLHCLIGNNGQG
jgi:ADP-ribose pyrophosphatase